MVAPMAWQPPFHVLSFLEIAPRQSPLQHHIIFCIILYRSSTFEYGIHYMLLIIMQEFTFQISGLVTDPIQ